MNRLLALIVFSAVAVLGGTAAADSSTYTDLPIERRMLFNKWQGAGASTLTDYGDYYTNWTHDGPMMPGFAQAFKRTLAGTNHVHTAGWTVKNARTGSISALSNASYINPADYTFGGVTYTNWNANLRNVVGASLESPVYADGIGVIYFDVVNELPYTAGFDISVQVATNKITATGASVPLTNPNGTVTWTEVTNFNVQAMTHFTTSLQYGFPAAFKVVRTSTVNAITADGAFICIDNLSVSYPRAGVTVTQPAIEKVPAMPTSAKITCTVTNQTGGTTSSNTGRTVTLYYKSDTQTDFTTAAMSYVIGTGDGAGNGEDFSATIDFPEGDSTASLTYYCVCSVVGNRYLPTDFTQQGYVFWDTADGAEPPREGISPTRTTDVSMWVKRSYSSILPIDRKMLFNKWEETDSDSGLPVLNNYGDYYVDWTHVGPMMGGFAAAYKSTLAGTNHVHASQWSVCGGRTGTTALLGNAVYPKTYTFEGVSYTNWQASLQNISNARIISPFYTNGIGTIYFDAVNVSALYPVDLAVEIATNMVEDTGGGLTTTNSYPIGADEYDILTTGEVGGVEMVITGHVVYAWQTLSTDTLAFDSSAETNVFHFQRTLNYRGGIRVRLRRSSSPVANVPADNAFLAIDNIQISVPPADVEIKKDELTFEPPYPYPGEPFNVRCRVSNVDDRVPTTHEKRLVQVVYRWRYLDQVVNDWTTNTMDYVSGADGDDGIGNNELYSVALPGQEREGDLEYYFICSFDGYRYKPVDYTQTGRTFWTNALEVGTENVSPRFLRNTLQGGEDEFSVRIRRHASEYGQVFLAVDKTNLVEMTLMGDGVWWGWIPLIVNGSRQITSFSFNFMGTNRYDEATETVSSNAVYWGEANQSTVATMPSGGKCVEVDADTVMAVSVKNSRYALVKFNMNEMSYVICRAEYQNFNHWAAPDSVFFESNGQSTKQSFLNDFESWATNEDTTISQYFQVHQSVYITNAFYPFFETVTPNMYARSAAYEYDRTRATGNNVEPGYNQIFLNQALRLMGSSQLASQSAAFTELGALYTKSKTSLVDGLKSINFNAHVALKDGPIAYRNDQFSAGGVGSGYTFNCTLSTESVSPAAHSYSILGYYQDEGNFYEMRVTQVAITNDAAISSGSIRVTLNRWKNGKIVQTAQSGALSGWIQNGNCSITLSTDGGSTTFTGSFRSNPVTLTYSFSGTGGSVVGERGTVGIRCSDCQVTASGMTFTPKGGTQIVDFGPLPSSYTTGIQTWSWPSGTFTAGSVARTLTSVVPSQSIGLYTLTTDYDSAQANATEPDGSITSGSTTNWVLRKTFTVNTYGYQTYSYQPEDWHGQFVRIQMLPNSDFGADVVLDEITERSWHAKQTPEGKDVTAWMDWIAKEAWIASSGDSTHGNVLEFNHTRANPGKTPTQASGQTEWLRSLYLTNGVGSLEFDYRVTRAPVKLTVQHANRYGSDWEDVESILVTSAMSKWLHSSVYIGNTNAGYVRVVSDFRGTDGETVTYTNGIVQLDNVTAWDEPYVDNTSWKAYNAKITGQDLSRVILDETRACFLNNSTTDEARPEQAAFTPFIQAPLLQGGLGVISFDARTYNAGDSSATVYVWVTKGDWYSTNGWERFGGGEDMITVDTPYYKRYTWSAGTNNVYTGVRLATQIGARRVCLENISIDEPVNPGFDIGGTRPICHVSDTAYRDDADQQPLASDVVGLEARLSNIRMSPSNIHVYVDYYIGTNVWGVGNWAAEKKTLPMYATPNDPEAYRTDPQNDIGYLEQNDVVQYRVWATCTDAQDKQYTIYQQESGFVNPSWYEPLDFNRTFATQGWSPYFIVYDIPKNSVFINEINSWEEDSLRNSPSNQAYYCQYVEIAVPEDVDLSGWSLAFVNGSSAGLETTTNYITLPAHSVKTAVTNGYAFYIVSEPVDVAKNTYGIVNPFGVDYGSYLLRQDGYLPFLFPGGVCLQRPMGMIEQTVAYNLSDELGSGKVWADADPAGRFIYVGKEIAGGSLSVINGHGGETNNWIEGAQWTPGLPNVGQVLPPIPPYFAGISNVIVTASMNSYEYGTQNGQRSRVTFKTRRGSSTNIIYSVTNWYRVVAITTNGVDAYSVSQAARNTYTLPLDKLTTNVTVFATVSPAPELGNLDVPDVVKQWILTFPDEPFATSTYNDKEMSLTDLYFFQISPMLTHKLYGYILNVEHDASTNYFVTAYLSVDGSNCVSLASDVTFKIQAKHTITNANWTFVRQYSVDKDSFDTNHTCRIYVPNPYDSKLYNWTADNLFLRWAIEFDQQSDFIAPLTNCPVANP
jgi:hypothetical protein